MDRTYVDENEFERRRLCALAASLTDVDFDCTLPSGLTVAGAMVHLAFWDDYCDALLREWQESGFSPIRGNLDAINAALGAIAPAIPGPAAVALVLDAASRADARVASASPDLVATIEGEGHLFMLNRAIHRRIHLDQIEQAIGA